MDEIDSMGIAPATKLAMQRAIEESLIRPDYLLIDAVKLDDLSVPQQSIIKGDQISRTIAAASIVAKVIRDQYMSDISLKYPGYHFEKNKDLISEIKIHSQHECDSCMKKLYQTL